MPKSAWSPAVKPDCFVSNFAYPVITESRDIVSDRLMREGIECRPLISGSMANQPVYIKNFQEDWVEGYLPMARAIHSYGMYVPNHPGLSSSDITKICGIVFEASPYAVQ